MATVFYIVLWSPGIPSYRQPSPSTWSLKADIFIEAVTNAAFYNPFTGDRTSLFTGLKLYILHRVYNQGFGDIVPSIISNALCVRVDIVNEGTAGDYDVLSLLPVTGPSVGHITLHRRQDHYNGLVRVVENRLTKPRLQYDSDTLKSLQPIITRISRSVRKSLFRLDIWKPCHHARSGTRAGRNTHWEIEVKITKKRNENIRFVRWPILAKLVQRYPPN